MRSPNRRVAVALPASGLLLVAGTGCSTGGQHASPPGPSASLSSTTSSQRPTSAPTTPSTTTSTVEVQAVIQAYDGMWADMAEAAQTADYGSPTLAAHTVDPATGQLQRTLLTFHQMGWVAKGNPVPHPTVVSMSPPNQPTSAQVVDCLDNTHWLTYRADTGALADDQPGQRHSVSAVLRLGTDGWKVESFEVGAGGSC